MFESHDIEQNRQYSIGDMLKDLPGISSQGLGNASRPIIRGMNNSRVKILQNSGSLSDVSEFGEDPGQAVHSLEPAGSDSHSWY